MNALTTLLRKYLLVVGLTAGFAALGYAQGVETVCTGQTKKYKANASYPGSEFVWKLTGGTVVDQTASGDTIVVKWSDVPGDYWIKLVEHNFGCQSDTVWLQVNVLQIPSIYLEPTVMLCEGKTVNLTAEDGFDSYLWSTGDETQSITVSEAGEYTIQAQYFCGLVYDTVVVELVPLPFANAGPDITIKKGEGTWLTAENYPDYSYLWAPPEWLDNPESYTTWATPEATTVFNLTVTDQFGCTNTDNVTVIIVEENQEIFIYNGFTPNGDGFNDTWEIMVGPPGSEYEEQIPVNQVYQDVIINVFDRNNHKVFHSIDYNNDWDGTHYKNQNKLPLGTYFYVIKIDDKTFRGTVSILR